MCKPIEEGELNIKYLRRTNKALLLKLIWQFAAGQNRIWIEIMHAKYNADRDFWEDNPLVGVSALWRTMHKSLKAV
jgi:hypothetical protein